MKIFFWSIPFISLITQFLFTFNSLSQIRYDELAESVRNVFWLQNRLLYDGTSSNVGFYGPLLLIYNIFGFDLHIAKYFRLFLHAISIFCLAAILYKWLGMRRGLLPLLVISLSPTLFYMNTLQSSIGIDLQYFPIAFFLIYFSNFRKKTLSLLMQFLAWTLSMVAWMSYPAFIFYLPVLGLLSLSKIKKNRLTVIASAAGFFWPFLIAFLYLKDRWDMLYDPISKSGIFRAAGSFSFNSEVITASLGGIFRDLFLSPESYQFELFKGEFSDIYPILSFLAVVVISLYLIKLKRSKIALAGLCLMIIAIILPSLTFDPSGHPGIRRATAFLAFFYVLYVVAWDFLSSAKAHLVIKILLILLLVHHIIVLPFNLLHMKDPLIDRYPLWFTIQDTPKESLQSLVDTATKEDLKLVCLDPQTKQPFYCRLSEVYAGVGGSCIWNDLDCNQILGYDLNKGELIPLSTELWETYYFEH